MPDDPFNPDQRDAQSRAGGGPQTAPIRRELTLQQQRFFPMLSYVAAATVDPDGWPLATLLTGAPGFIQAPDPVTLHIAASEPAFRPDQPIGLLGIDLANRRRNRANGVITTAGLDGIRVQVRESFGNCPKYIQRRDVEPAARHPEPAETMTRLDAAAQEAVAVADTMFVATRARAGFGGVDISHRGGKPGFMNLEGERLTVPDYEGNQYYNTLGNLLGDDRAALLLVDFDRGDLFHLQGRVTIDWAGAPAGPHRTWTLAIERVWRRHGAVPLRWSAPEPSPFLADTGS